MSGRRLSDLVGSRVRLEDGTAVGRLLDVAVDLAVSPPGATRLVLGAHHAPHRSVGWASVASCEPGDVALRAGSSLLDDVLGDREVLLVRDVLDTQVIDVAGKRLARVSDVLLDGGQHLVVVAVEVGLAGVLRRLGLRRLADRTAPRTIPFGDLHLTSDRGHQLQVAMPEAGLQRLDTTQLASVVAHLPAVKAAQVLHAASPDVAAGALSASHPRVSARLLHAVPRATAASLVDRMPVDDATSALRGLPRHDVQALLDAVGSERAETLRRLLEHPAGTAGGLMNTQVLTAPADEPLDSIRARVAAEPAGSASPTTVVVLDAQGRPVGTFEPIDLLAGRGSPRAVPHVLASTPVERVIDLFALHDLVAVPVVDGDGRLVGLLTVGDVLEEVLAERLPGQGRYHRVRRVPRRDRRRPEPRA